MGKKLNPMKVRKAMTYEVNELAHALGVTPVTIRNMVRRGLPIMATKKPYLFIGEAVREFIVEENKSKKCPMSLNECRCMSCRQGRKPAGMAVTMRGLNAKSALLMGVCNVCGSTCTRMISLARVSEFAEIFEITKKASSAA